MLCLMVIFICCEFYFSIIVRRGLYLLCFRAVKNLWIKKLAVEPLLNGFLLIKFHLQLFISILLNDVMDFCLAVDCCGLRLASSCCTYLFTVESWPLSRTDRASVRTTFKLNRNVCLFVSCKIHNYYYCLLFLFVLKCRFPCSK